MKQHLILTIHEYNKISGGLVLRCHSEFKTNHWWPRFQLGLQHWVTGIKFSFSGTFLIKSARTFRAGISEQNTIYTYDSIDSI